ncbi:MAG: DEAD/DEAH box helicase [Phycisphaerales bacterium]|nr:MAG: DEAD/DEAH box helicase [Phycisphaerales bacterium]
MPFKTFGLSDPLVQGILATGYTAPTEIQSQAIPAALSGQDIIGCAQTGTGKTAAFVLPVLDRLSHEHTRHKRRVKALILTPTRELAVQIERCILNYGRFLPVRALAVYGGVNIARQITALKSGVDMLVATPGRLMDHMEHGTVDLGSIEVLVLDEADRMLDMGFIRDVRKIVAALPRKRQTMLFSATISPEVKTISDGLQKAPKMIQIGRRQNPVETVTQHVYPVARQQKVALLLHMLQTDPMYSVLVFSRTKHGADKIRRKLARADIEAVAIHSNRSQSQRQKALDGFRNGRYQVMVATDIAARGIDVQGISHVINFDVPAFAEDYIHRIGRTGRAAATGDAITFVAPEEQEHLRKIEKFIDRRFAQKQCPGFAYAKSHLAPGQPSRKQPAKPTRPRQRPGKKSQTTAKSAPSAQPASAGQSRSSRQRRRKQAKRRTM